MECEYNRKYRVFFSAYQRVSGHIDVVAENREQAEDIAYDEGCDDDWDDYGDTDDLEIDETVELDSDNMPIRKAMGGSLLPQHENAATGYKGQEQMLM